VLSFLPAPPGFEPGLAGDEVRRILRLRMCAAALAVASLAALLPVEGAFPPAPGFTLQLLDGHTLSLASLRGSPVLLLFWAPW